MNRNKYVFFGSPEFAAIILERLIKDGNPPEVLVCNPDRPQGRKKILTSPAAKIIAQKNNIKVWQPEKILADEWENEIGKVDYAIVAAYSKIIKDEILGKIPLGVIGVHPSLLPFYRGATPIQTAILNGERKTGVTLYLIDKEVDHGPILSQKEVIIGENEGYSSLMVRLAVVSGELIGEMLSVWLAGDIDPKEQDHSKATFTKKFTREDGFIDPANILKDGLTEELNNKIRALNPEPGTWTYGTAFPNLNIPPDKMVKILESKRQDGKLKISLIQIEGKTPKTI